MTGSLGRPAGPIQRVAGLVAALLVAGCYGGPGGSAQPSYSPTAVPSSAATSSPQPFSAAPSAGPTPSTATGLLLVFSAPGPGPEATPQTAALLGTSDGVVVDLGRAQEASWTHDGRGVHLVRPGDSCVPQLLTVAPDGKLRSSVSAGLRSEDWSFVWSPDDRSVAFLRYHDGPPPKMCGSMGGTYAPEMTVTDIMVMAANGSGQRLIVAGGWPSHVAWSPDGSRIAFLDPVPPVDMGYRGRLAVVDVATGSIRRLTETLEDPDQVMWAPDGQTVLIRYAASGSYRLGAVDSATGRLTDVLSIAEGTQALALSPDGSRVAAGVWLFPGSDLFVGNVRTGSVTTVALTDIEAFGRPSWSPDGTWVALSWSATGTAGDWTRGIDVMTLDGRDRRTVPGSVPFELVSWQPEAAS